MAGMHAGSEPNPLPSRLLGDSEQGLLAQVVHNCQSGSSNPEILHLKSLDGPELDGPEIF